MSTALYPFALNFNGVCASFPFIFEDEQVLLAGGNPAPSCYISARTAGDMIFRGIHSPVRKAFFRSLGIQAEKVYSLIQIHSKDVFAIGKAGLPLALPDPADFVQEGDGMVSFCLAAIPAVTVADCLPVFLLDTQKGFLAVLHSGWKGTGIVLNALEIMQEAGSKPEAIAAVLGPCIQSCSYRVDEERAKQFEKEFGTEAETPLSGKLLGPVSRRDDSGWYINLQAANVRLLSAAGVRHIAYCTDCTFTNKLLGSFRREGPQSFTHMIALAGRAANDELLGNKRLPV